MTSAEEAYEFQHHLVRDAAYQMQLPTDRAELHGVAFQALNQLTSSDDHPATAAEIFSHANSAGLAESVEAYSYLKLAADWAVDHYNGVRAIEFLGRIMDHPVATLQERLDAALRLGSQLLHIGRPQVAAQQLEAALELAEEKNAEEQGRLTSALASVYMESGRLKDADALFERAIELLRESDDVYHLGIALTNRAVMFRHSGKPANVEALLKEALEVHRRVGNRHYEGFTLMALGGSRRAVNDDKSAEDNYRQALEIFTQQGNRREEAVTWGNLANVYLQTERRAEAEAAYLRALRSLREMGNLRSEAIVLGNLGNLLWGRGRIGRCLAAQFRSIELLWQIGDLMLLPAFRAMLATHLLQLGEIDAARDQLSRAVAEGEGQGESIASLDYVLPRVFELHLAEATGTWGIVEHPPDPGAMKKAREVFARIRKASKRRDTESTAVIRGELQTYMKKLQLAESGRGSLFNGNQLDSPLATRRALLARLQALAPQRLAQLKSELPALYEAYFAPVENEPEPDWRDDTLPG